MQKYNLCALIVTADTTS